MKGLFVSLLLTGFCQAVQVYLHPEPHVPHHLSASRAGAVLSKHLSLERFEDATPFAGEQEILFGQGPSTGVLVRISAEDAQDVVPESMKKHSFSINSDPTHDSLSALIPTYLDRAHHVYSYVHEKTSESSSTFQELSDLKEFLQTEDTPDRFGAFDFSTFSALKHSHDASHTDLIEARRTLHDILSSASKRADINLAIVSASAHVHTHKGHHQRPQHHHHNGKRQQQPPQSPLPPPIAHPAEPIDSISTCYASADTCGNATSSCSGHGECVQASKAGKTCFVCACSVTSDAQGRKEQWAGNACERKDVSGPFVLLAGTTVTLAVLIFGSIGLLTAVGGEKLPSTLTGDVGHSRG